MSPTSQPAGSSDENKCSSCEASIERLWGHLVGGLCIDCREPNPPSEEAVKVTAADYNGRTWDGSPFSSLPEWLQEAVEQGIVSVEPSNTDYALWRVVTVVGPGDQIVKSSLASATKGAGMRKALECCLEQLVAYEENGWLGEGWRTRVGLRSDIDRARAALNE